MAEKNEINIEELIEKEFDNLINLNEVDTTVKTWLDTGVYALNYICSKNLFGAIPVSRVSSIKGLTGCLSKETKLRIRRGKRIGGRVYSIEDLYIKFHGGRAMKQYKKWKNNISSYTYSYNEKTDSLQYNKIIDVVKKGEQEVFELTLESGKKIKATKDHPFKVKNEYINERGIKEKENFVALNNLKIGDLICCKNNEKYKGSFKRFGKNNIKYEKITSIRKIGEEMTYDLIMDDPNRNYLANDIVVHNTGKSLILASIMKDPQLDYILVIETEGGGSSKELYEFAGVDTSKLRMLKSNTFGNYRIKKADSTIEEISDSKFPKKKDTKEWLYVEGITRILKKFINTIDFNNVKKNIFIVLDSLGNTQSVRELSGTPDMGAKTKDIATFFRCFDNAFERTNIAFVFSNKLYTNIGNKYIPFIESGGVNAVYNPSLSIELADTSETDDISDTEMKAERERRKTALGSSVKPIRATVSKSRFGTELRRCHFLLDMAIGPAKYSGLFGVLKDFGVLKRVGGSSYYEIPELWEKSFMRKDFINRLRESEKENLDKIQDLLNEKEKEIISKKKELQITSDVEEPILDDSELNEEDNSELNEEDAHDLKKEMGRDVEK